MAAVTKRSDVVASAGVEQRNLKYHELSLGQPVVLTAAGRRAVFVAVESQTVVFGLFSHNNYNHTFLDPEGGSQKSHSSCSCCCYQFSEGPKIPKAFLISSRAQQNLAYTFVLTLPTDLLSQIFHLISN